LEPVHWLQELMTWEKQSASEIERLLTGQLQRKGDIGSFFFYYVMIVFLCRVVI
jgi:hypothetical protein